MLIKQYFCYIFFLSFLLSQNNTIVHIPITGDIDMGLPYYIERGIKFAEQDSAKLIIFEIDTFGGRVDAATKIKDLISNPSWNNFNLLIRIFIYFLSDLLLYFFEFEQ